MKIIVSLMKDIVDLVIAGILIFTLIAAFETPYLWIVFFVFLGLSLYRIIRKK
jgi:hypothetical protein